METKALVAQNIVKRYGNKEVLHGVSLTIEPNKIYGLIGRNGAGKTTLLGILTAQNTLDSGSVTYGGEPVWENRRALDDICFSRELSATILMGQNTTKVSQMLTAGSYYYPRWDADYAERLVKLFGLDKKKKICKLSKGMMSMVTIILALASKAPITILDEPVAGLDVVAREEFYKLLLDDYQKTGRTFVISTHIIEEAASVFEEVIFLDKGELLAMGNTDEMLSHYCYFSGKDSEVDAVAAGAAKVLHSETLGRSKTVCVQLPQGSSAQLLASGHEVEATPVPLQKLFVYLSGGLQQAALEEAENGPARR